MLVIEKFNGISSSTILLVLIIVILGLFESILNMSPESPSFLTKNTSLSVWSIVTLPLNNPPDDDDEPSVTKLLTCKSTYLVIWTGDVPGSDDVHAATHSLADSS